jgi:hypothetical protein
MGFELWEFLLRLEVVFGIDLPLSSMKELRSPADVINYVWARIPHGIDEGCLSQKAFYRIRRLICQTSGVERQSVSVNMFFTEIISSSGENDTIHELLINEFDDVNMPSLSWEKKWVFEGVIELVRHLVTGVPFRIATVAELVKYVVAERPFSLKPKSDGWSRREVGEVIKTRSIRELCVNYPSESDLFEGDLGVTE